MDSEKDEWDGPWKDALDSLPLVFGLFWPDVLGELNLEKGWTPLEQELQKLTADASTGLLRVDKLFELVAAGTGDPRFAHLEAQMQKDGDLPKRVFTYGYRARDHFNQPVGSFAIYGDDDPNWRPEAYREGVFGCAQTTTFRIAKLLDWAGRVEELEAGDNLFGLFVAAHLATMQTRGDVPTRQDAKYRLLANLLRRDLPEQEVQRWYRLIDWILKLPDDANRAVWLRLQEIKESKTVAYITTAEKIGREKGRTEGIKDLLRDALFVKFPAEAASLFDAFKDEQDVDRLRFVHRALLLAQSLDDFRASVAATP